MIDLGPGSPSDRWGIFVFGCGLGLLVGLIAGIILGRG